MLKLKHLFENYDLAKEALRNWNHDDFALDDMLSKFRISSNAIYPFLQDGKVCFLRLAPTEEKLERNISGEMEFITYILKRGYQALVPIKSLTGEYYMKLNTQWGEYYASAFKCVNGIPIEDTDFSDEIMFAYGKSLGRLHSLAAQYVPKIKKWSHNDVLNWLGDVLREYKAPDYAMAELADVKNQLENLPIESNSYGLIHYDFELDNVFYEKETGECSVIDFDDGMYHWYALDIEQVFSSLEEELNGRALEKAKNKFISGYRTEHCFTADMEDCLPLMGRFINLYGYGRLIRCVAEKYAHEPEWLEELRIKLNEAILNKEASMKRELAGRS